MDHSSSPMLIPSSPSDAMLVVGSSPGFQKQSSVMIPTNSEMQEQQLFLQQMSTASPFNALAGSEVEAAIPESSSSYKKLMEALIHMNDATDHVGSTILLQESDEVNRKLLEYNAKFRTTSNKRSLASSDNTTCTIATTMVSNKKRKVLTSSPGSEYHGYVGVSEVSPSSSDGEVEDDEVVVVHKASSFNMIKDHRTKMAAIVEKKKILDQACRMKRMSVILKKLQTLQSTLMNELHECLQEQQKFP